MILGSLSALSVNTSPEELLAPAMVNNRQMLSGQGSSCLPKTTLSLVEAIDLSSKTTTVATRASSKAGSGNRAWGWLVRRRRDEIDSVTAPLALQWQIRARVDCKSSMIK
ncbi:hypothetical protein P3T76_011668 [Phytophthora citrophthora]|uniref:Uncharacterized protein n=1 Tax=Phytophthora citrophthora TaxID=4793 RepID=A0AAD9LER0_9STRA|nr:hypothetical protein P3T76_011668 [Phytophthora citrophthora]